MSRRKGRNIRPCKVPGCTDETGHPGTALGYCSRHYNRYRRNGDPAIRTTRVYVTHLPCTVDGCTDRQTGRGLCARHWAERKRADGGPWRSRRYWTPDEDRRLLDLPVERWGAVVAPYLSDLAYHLERTPSACRSRLWELRNRRAKAASLT